MITDNTRKIDEVRSCQLCGFWDMRVDRQKQAYSSQYFVNLFSVAPYRQLKNNIRYPCGLQNIIYFYALYVKLQGVTAIGL